MAGPSNNKRTLLVAVGVLLIAGYRLASPYIDETNEMRGKFDDLKKQIDEVKNTAAMYGKGWEKKMDEREKEAARLLPDTLNSSGVLNYFLTGYEQKNPGSVWFLSVNYQNGGNSSFSVGKGRDQVSARSARYDIKAQMDQAKVVNYIDYLEKYPGLSRAEEFTFSVPREKAAPGILEMDVHLEFFLAPAPWVQSIDASKLAESRGTASDEKPEWQEIFISHPMLSAPRSGGPVGASSEPSLGPGKLPAIDEIVGTSIVVNETLYEEGDSIRGWKIVEVDPVRKLVTLRTRSSTRKVRVR